MEEKLFEQGWEKISTTKEGDVETNTYRKGDQERVLTIRRAFWLSRKKVEELRRLYQTGPENVIREEG